MLNEIGQNYNEASNRTGSVCNRKADFGFKTTISFTTSLVYIPVSTQDPPLSWQSRISFIASALISGASGRGRQLGLLLPNATSKLG